MISHLFFIELGRTLVLHHVKRYLFVNRPSERREIVVDQWKTLSARLSEAASNWSDIRIYIIADGNLHFSFELPRLESEEDLRFALMAKLKKELLFPVSDFVFAFSTVQSDRNSLVTVTGCRRGSMAQAFSAVARAGLSVHRVYMRDDLIVRALLDIDEGKVSQDSTAVPPSGTDSNGGDSGGGAGVRHSATAGDADATGDTGDGGESEAAAGFGKAGNGDGTDDDEERKVFLVCDRGFLFVDISGEQPEVKRIPPVGASNEARLSRLVHLVTRGACRRVRVSRELADADLPLPPGVIAVPIASSEDEERELIRRYLDHPWKISSHTPFAEMTSEAELGFRPTRTHAVMALVVLYLAWCFLDIHEQWTRLQEESSSLAAATLKVERAKRTIANCKKKMKQLQGVDKAFSLFDSEGFSTLRLIEVLSSLKPGDTFLQELAPSRSKVFVKAEARSKQDVFEFVGKLSSSPFFETARLKELTFRRGGRVFFTLELTRNG